MKKEEIIELNGKEYTLVLNRESFIKIDQYSNIQKSMDFIEENLYEYKKEIKDGEDPFANNIDEDKLEKETQEKIDALVKIVENAFWIWLYPNYKLNISQVKELLNPYIDNDAKFKWICEKYGEYLEKSVQVRNEYLEERKNQKALANK